MRRERLRLERGGPTLSGTRGGAACTGCLMSTALRKMGGGGGGTSGTCSAEEPTYCEPGGLGWYCAPDRYCEPGTDFEPGGGIAPEATCAPGRYLVPGPPSAARVPSARRCSARLLPYCALALVEARLSAWL